MKTLFSNHVTPFFAGTKMTACWKMDKRAKIVNLLAVSYLFLTKTVDCRLWSEVKCCFLQRIAGFDLNCIVYIVQAEKKKS